MDTTGKFQHYRYYTLYSKWYISVEQQIGFNWKTIYVFGIQPIMVGHGFGIAPQNTYIVIIWENPGIGMN